MMKARIYNSCDIIENIANDIEFSEKSSSRRYLRTPLEDFSRKSEHSIVFERTMQGN
jgi:hypothetical protein